MELSDSLNTTLGRLKHALAQGGEHLILDILEACDLKELLSQDTISFTRRRREAQMCSFLCTLAAANNVSATRAQLWLDCYQSIKLRQLEGALQKLSERNVLRVTVEALMSDEELTPKKLQRAKGTDQTWQDSLELCVDFNSWTCAVRLLEAKSAPQDTLFWVQALKALALRDQADDTVVLPLPIDYAQLARLYELCGQGIRRQMLGIEAIDETAQLSGFLGARALERARRYDEALELLRLNPKGSDPFTLHQAIARNLCKRGDLQAAIAQLDMQAETFLQSNSGVQVGDMNVSLTDTKSADQDGFTVEGASLALQDLARTLSARDHKVFLVSGTLLGYRREGKLLDHDKDIDVGVVGWTEQFEIFDSLWRSNLFHLSAKYLKGKDTYYIAVVHVATKITIDIFLYKNTGDKLVTGLDFLFGHRQTFAFTPFALKQVNFLGVDLYVPDNVDLNLEENFGAWRVPDPSYISHLESPSTMDKGGLEFMITARLHLLKALDERKSTRLRKVIAILAEHRHKPGSMDAQLLRRVELLCQQREALSSIPPTPEKSHLREVAYA